MVTEGDGSFLCQFLTIVGVSGISGIHSTVFSSSSIEFCNLYNNSMSSDEGGAVLFTVETGMNISNCIFSNNSGDISCAKSPDSGAIQTFLAVTHEQHFFNVNIITQFSTTGFSLMSGEHSAISDKIPISIPFLRPDCVIDSNCFAIGSLSSFGPSRRISDRCNSWIVADTGKCCF
jgi:hypothetical protein